MIDKDSLPLDKPRRTPGHPTKSHVVKTRVDGSEKIIRFGEQGASTAGKPKEGESEAMKQKRASFKARHAQNIAKGKSSPAYWANKTKWATGGSVGLEDLDEKYEGIKKPDFKMLESFRDLIRTLQERAADSGTQEFDPVRALGRSGAAGSLEDLYEAYSDKPASHASRAEAGAKDPKRTETAKMVFDSFKNAGFSDAQAKVLTAEINREGSFNPAYLYGSHTDAANRATNVGMLSWQGDRANRLMSFMADRGLIDPAGRIAPGQDALNAQAEYLRWEMENDPSYAATRETFLGNPNIDQETAHNILGKNFIRWRIDDPKYRGSGFDRIYEGYDLLNMAQGFAEGGLAELDHKYKRGGKKKEAYDSARAAAKEDKGLPYSELLIDNLIGLDNKYLSAGERLGRAINEDPLGFLKSAGSAAYEGAKGAVTSPIETIQGVGDSIYGSGESLLRGLDGKTQELFGVGYDEATPDQITLAREALAGDVLNVSQLIPGAVVARKGVGAVGDTMRAVGRDVVDRLNQPGPMPTTYANPIPGKGPSKIPDLRTLPVEEAVRIAKREPHLIESGNRSEGLYVGGPRTIQSKRDLNRMRRELDAYIAADPRGGDWYDRYRAGVNEVTGGDPVDNYWMTNLEGQYSAGVSPEGELGFALKDTNSMIATGDPGKPARPAQAEASRRAAATGSPDNFQLGPKTGEYAKRVDPTRQGLETATGVNDFRHLRNLGYTEVGGEAQRNAVGAAGHRFADYETALAVGRANKAGLAGRSDWTGEQLQAAPWVRQKALDLLERGQAPYEEKATKLLLASGSNASPDRVREMAYELAFQDANKTIADFFPKHTAFATHEAQPYRYGDHLSGLADAPSDVKSAFAADPRSTWAIAPGGRDAIYSGLRFGDTGYAMRVRPTVGMQGVYEAPGGMLEYNMGEVARPLVSFDSGKVKTISAPDRALLDMSEALRGYVDYQGATPWHKAWVGGQPGMSNSVVATRAASSPATPEDIIKLRELGAKYGLPDVIDTGDGVTFTNFADDSFNLDSKAYKALGREITKLGGFKGTDRAKIDSGYPGYEGTWEAGMGSGAATRQLFTYLDAAPSQALKALDANPLLAKAALNRLERDADYAQQWGAAREDVQNARRIIGDGPGWVNRLRKALSSGAVLPGVAAALIVPQMQDEESAQ